MKFPHKQNKSDKALDPLCETTKKTNKRIKKNKN